MLTNADTALVCKSHDAVRKVHVVRFCLEKATVRGRAWYTLLDAPVLTLVAAGRRIHTGIGDTLDTMHHAPYTPPLTESDLMSRASPHDGDSVTVLQRPSPI